MIGKKEALRRRKEFHYRFESNYETLPLHLEHKREEMRGQLPITTDSLYFGNETRFINHSCTPNAKSREIPLFNNYESLFGANMIFAERRIEKGEEITMNYYWTESEDIKQDLQCLCYPGCPKVLIKAIKRRRHPLQQLEEEEKEEEKREEKKEEREKEEKLESDDEEEMLF